MARSLYTLAYPTLTPADRKIIETLRREYDLPYRDIVAAHITMVFANSSIDEGRYIAHIKKVASSSKPISFVCRYAMLGVDDENDTGYVFLVPDEGFSGISILHDQLYTECLAPTLRLDLPYIPHITIGTLPNHQAAKILCDRLNTDFVSIAGSLDALTVGALERNRITDLVRVPLG